MHDVLSQAVIASADRTVGGAIRRLGALFEKAGIQSAQLDARMLVAHACSLSPEDAIAQRALVLSSEAETRIAAYASRRLAREPVSRILGRRDFWSLSLCLAPDVLDPRPETELLVEVVLAYVKKENLGRAPIRLLDLGTGSGCLLAALLTELPLAFGVGVDKSITALNVAQKNLSRVGLLDRFALLCGDWGNCLSDASFDIVVCNPPYIASRDVEGLHPEVRDYEPKLALDGGRDGLDAYRLILTQVFAVLRDKALMAFETGAGQARSVLEMMTNPSSGEEFSRIEILRDLSGIERVVAGVRQSARCEAVSKKKIGNPARSR